MSNVEWMSFGRLRGDAGRTWFRRSDIITAIAAEGSPFTWYDAKKVLAGLPRPAKRYGHNQYTQQHLDAVLAAAKREMK